jgi:hypothetical protein
MVFVWIVGIFGYFGSIGSELIFRRDTGGEAKAVSVNFIFSHSNIFGRPINNLVLIILQTILFKLSLFNLAVNLGQFLIQSFKPNSFINFQLI